MPRPGDSIGSTTSVARRLLLGVLVALLALPVSLSAWSHAVAQDDDAIDAELERTLTDETLIETVIDETPFAPSFVRLLRITMEPGSTVPRRTHSGPKVDLIQSGTLLVQVDGAEDELDRAATISTTDGAPPTRAPIGEEFTISDGQAITIPTDTIYQFRNESDEPVVLITVIFLPAGHQRPPSIAYPDGDPPEDAYAGISNQVLGDGVATALPTGASIVTLERITITEDEPLAAFEGPVLVSLADPRAAIRVEDGMVQVSRTVTPGPQRESPPGTEMSLIPGDALFFPAGMDELALPEDGEPITVLRLILVPVSGEAFELPDDTLGAVTLTTGTTSARDATPVAAVEDEDAGRPERQAPPGDEPTDEPAPGGIEIGSTVVTTDPSVNIRAEPSLTGEVVIQLEEGGVTFVVIGPAVEADGFVWFQVQGLDDPSITGFVAADFLSLV